MFSRDLLGKRIRKARGKKSQDVFAAELGISRGALSFYENGERLPDAEIIYKICECCNVSAGYLLGFTDNTTTDTDLQAVCDYTGLSEEAVNKLRDDVTVRLPAEISDLLKEYRQYWVQLRLKYGDKWNYFINIPDGKGVEHKEKADFLFIREDGGKIGYPINPDSITDWFNKFSERHGLPHINPHAFRHTLASVLCLNGVDMTTISKWLGHKNVTTTMNIYEHILESGREQVVNCVSDVIFGSGDNKNKAKG